MLELLRNCLSVLPSGNALARRAWVEVKYTPKAGGEAKDISEDISKYFLSLSFTDNLSDTVDDVTLTLEDKAQLWLEEWFPETGAKLDITIFTYNWTNLAEGQRMLPLGAYEIDEIEAEGFPSTVQIKAVSVLGNSGLRGVKKNRTWENISVWKCASDICKDNGKNLKVMIDKIVIFDDMKYEGKTPMFFCLKPGAYGVASSTDELTLSGLTDYKLKSKTRDVYYKCHVRYQKTQDKSVIEGEFTAPDRQDGLTFTINEQVADTTEANRLAKKKLREKNKEAFTGSMSLVGNFYVMAGLVIELKGFGKFDGNYIIVKAEHQVGAAYTTSMDIRRCLHGY